MSNRYWMISFHKNTRNLTVRSVPKEDIVHNIELIIRSLNIFIEKFLSIEYTNVEGIPLTSRRITIMGLKPGPKPIAKSTGKPDQRRRDNKDTPGNTPGLKPSKSTGKVKNKGINTYLYPDYISSLLKVFLQPDARSFYIIRLCPIPFSKQSLW